MKKTLFLYAAICCLGNMAAQTKVSPQPSGLAKDSATKSRVTTEDPMNKASWKTKGTGAREFSDTTLKKDRTVTYDATGNMVISDDADNTTAPNAYPPAIGDYYTQKYPGERFKVQWSKDETGNKVYYISRKNEVLWFDQKGGFKSKTTAVSK